MDHLVTALWHLMGNLKFIVNQNRGRTCRDYIMSLSLYCAGWSSHFKTC